MNKKTNWEIAQIINNKNKKKHPKWHFNPEEIESRMNRLSSNAVEDNLITVSKEDIWSIVECLRIYDRHYLLKNFSTYKFAYRQIDMYGMSVLHLTEDQRLMLIGAIEDGGHKKAHYELLKELLRWYGIERLPNVQFNKMIPQDERAGFYSDEYDGPEWRDFVDQSAFFKDELDEERKNRQFEEANAY